MSKVIAGHLVSPFSTPVTYFAPEYKGFIGVPRNNIHVPGWGEPYKDAKGKAITPGTLGGPGQAALVRKEKGKWKSKRHKQAQRFGEISWRGHLRDATKPSAGKYLISYHGPMTRHFATPSFVYGSDSKHRNVYMSGGMIGIAPGPVLGGCLQTISKKMYLTVVCIRDGVETVLRRTISGPVYSDKEEELKKLADFASEAFPDGWRTVGTVTVDPTYSAAKTPWFFNASGTEAQCIRHKMKEGQFDGNIREERAGDRFKLLLTGSSPSVMPLGNLPAYAFTETGTLTDKGMWTSPPDAEGYPHKWREFNLNVNATTTGAQIVAVDYDGDAEILVKVEIDVDYRMNQDYMEGKDVDLYEGIPLGDPPGYRNWLNNPPGFRYANPYALGFDPLVTVGNHMGECWWGGSAYTYMSFTRGGTEYRITLEIADTLTEEEYNGLPRDPANHIIFLRFYELQYVRFLDVRAGGLVATRLEVFEQWDGQKTSTKSVHETYDTDFGDNKVTGILEGKKVQTPMTPTYHPRLNRHPDYAMQGTWEIISGLGRSGTPGWTTGSWTWAATTWVGNRPDNNDEAQLGNLPVNSWFPVESPLYRKSWYGLKIFYHEYNTESAAFCQREDKTFILSGELPHPDTGEPTNFLVTNPEEIGQVIDGPVYYPIGEM